MVCHDSVPGVHDKKPQLVCHDAGVCLCTREGKELRWLGSRFLDVLRAICPANSTLRSDLTSCMLGCLLVGTPLALAVSGEDGGALQAGGAGYAATASEMFLHVAAQNLSPFRPTLQPMVVLEIGPRRARCKALPEWRTMYEALQHLDRRLRWQFRLFRLVDSMAPLAAVEVGVQEYAELALLAEAEEGIVFWAGPAEAHGARAARYANHGDQNNDEDMPGSDDGGEPIGEDDPGDAEGDDVGDFDPCLQSDSDDDGGPDDAAEALAVEQQLVVAEPVAAPPEQPEMVPLPLGDGPRYGRLPPLGGRGSAVEVFSVPGGEIRYYDGIRRFAAWCGNPNHTNRCRREKVSYSGRGGGQGRPLGFLMAWLARGADHDTQEQHMMLDMMIDYQSRLAGRQTLRDTPGSDALFAGERPAVDGEDEPIEHP